MRFPEFKAEWKRKKLGEVAEMQNNRKGNHLLYLSTEDMFPNFGGVKFSLKEDNSAVTFLQGDILMSNIRPYLRKIWYSNSSGGCSSDILVFRVKETFDSKYIFYKLSSDTFIDYVAAGAKGTKMPRGDKKQILKFPIFFSNLEEQTKIAFFLSLIDERISTQMKIIEEWEKLKKGMIDELFSQKMRFINEKKNFICKTKSLSTLLIKNNEKNKKRKYSKVQSVSNKLGFANQEEIFANRRVASINTSNYYVIRKGIFAYNPSRIDVGSLAYKVDDEISIISPLYVSFWTKKTYVVDLYLFYWFSSKYFITQMNSSFEGSVRNTLSYESLGRMKMVLPPIDKQQEIASILSSFDKKLSIERQILAQYQNQKKYLLQNMFI